MALLHSRTHWKKRNHTQQPDPIWNSHCPQHPPRPSQPAHDQPSVFSKPVLSCPCVQTQHLITGLPVPLCSLVTRWQQPPATSPSHSGQPERHLSGATFPSWAPHGKCHILHCMSGFHHELPCAEQLHQIRYSQHTAFTLWLLHTLCKALEQQRFYGW